jgi:hypothetical protein
MKPRVSQTSRLPAREWYSHAVTAVVKRYNQLLATRSIKSEMRTTDRRVESSDKPSISNVKGKACLLVKYRENSQPAQARVYTRGRRGESKFQYLKSFQSNNYVGHTEVLVLSIKVDCL